MKFKPSLGLVAGIIIFGGLVAYDSYLGKHPAAATAAAPSGRIADGTYAAAADSVVRWEGRKPLIMGYKDVGTLAIKEGSVTFARGKATAGRFVFDMNGLKVGATGKQKGEGMLEKHLKSKDFFNVEEHAIAELTIKEIAAARSADGEATHLVRGDLTIKGITNAVEFPATIGMKDGRIAAKATVELDRTRWDIRYASGKFFGDLGDKVIDDMFTVSFDILGDRVE